MKRKYKDIRTGVIGVGSMGQNHARIYDDISNLVAVSDVNKDQGSKVAKRFGVDWYGDYIEMLDKVDAVTVAVPTSMHLEVCQKVAESGVSLIVEKPLAKNLEEAQGMVQLSKKYDVTMAVGHIERHNPVIKLAKDKLSNGDWGELITLNSRRVSNFPERIHDVGVLFDLLIHDLDISNYLVDSKVFSVFSAGGKKRAEHEDFANVLLNFSNGVVSVSEANWLTPMKMRKLGLTTSRNYIELDYQDQTVTLFSSKYIDVNLGNLYKSNIEHYSENLPLKREEPLLLELLDFLKSYEGNINPLVTIEDGFDVITISEAALTSLKNNKVIKIEK